ncbi:conserved exported hypothetical protein [Rhodospirillaceae bacterium LM-1]|nr:conserved exported hypothetical protein [Rhodospirillaceae bacterium LM-1]
MFKKISTVALICFGLAACGGEAMDKFVADNAAKDKAPAAAAAPAPAKAAAPAPTKCEADLKKLDGAILGAYTKLTPAQFDKAGQLRDQLATACTSKASDAQVDALVAEANKVLTAPPAPAKKAPVKK